MRWPVPMPHVARSPRIIPAAEPFLIFDDHPDSTCWLSSAPSDGTRGTANSSASVAANGSHAERSYEPSSIGERGSEPGSMGQRATDQREGSSQDAPFEDRLTGGMLSTSGRARTAHLEEAAPWGLVLNTVLYMASPMSMPATFAAAGWGWSANLQAGPLPR